MTDKFDDFLNDALSAGRTEFDYGRPSSAQALLTEFNHRIAELVSAHGLDRIGNAIWFLYGCVSNTTHDALEPSADSGLDEFYDSIRVLYEEGFCAFCDNLAGHSHANPNSFATACYMLWDMDSGLEYLTLRGRPELFQFGERLVDFGLGHSHAACQESFLHCLGHLCFDRPDFVDSKVSQFLCRTDLDNEIKTYAMQCRTGMIL